MPPASIQVAGITLKTETIVDVNVMARRALKDEMPGIRIRGLTRAIAKGALQNQADKRLGPLGGLLATATSVVTEQADDRMWRSLPGVVAIARANLPEGIHSLSLDGRALPEPIEIRGQYAVVPLRVGSFGTFVGSVASIGQLAEPPSPSNAPADVAVAPAAGGTAASAGKSDATVVSTELVSPVTAKQPATKPVTKGALRTNRPSPGKTPGNKKDPNLQEQ
jgi:hypothetical protein